MNRYSVAVNAPDNPPAFRHSSDLPRLKALAFDVIRAAGESGADAAAVAAAALGSGKVPRPVAARLVDALLAGDRRIHRTPEGRYLLQAFKAPEGGVSLLEARFCVTDVETTGVSKGSRIIEIGAVRVEGLRRGEEFHSFVNVDVPIPPEITALTGITADMLVGAPGPAEALDAYLDFLGDAVFCAHNAPFDRRFVFGEVEHFLLRTVANPVLCTCLTARRALPGMASYGLDALSQELSVTNEMRHRGLGDARAAAEILVVALERLMEQGVRTLEEALRVQRKPAHLKFLREHPPPAAP